MTGALTYADSGEIDPEDAAGMGPQGGQNIPGMGGPLAGMMPQKTAMAVYQFNKQSLDLPWDAIDEFRKRYNPEFKKAKEEHDAAMQAIKGFKAPVDPRLPWLRAASGFLAPTRTGQFSESAGAAAAGFADERQKQQALEVGAAEKMAQLQQSGAHQGFQDAIANAGLDLKVGATISSLERARWAAQANRFKVVPTRGLVDTLDLSPDGTPKIKIPTISLQQMFTNAEANIRKSLGSQTVFGSPQEFETEVARRMAEYKQRIMADPDAALAGLVTNPAVAMSPPQQQPGGALPQFPGAQQPQPGAAPQQPNAQAPAAPQGPQAGPAQPPAAGPGPRTWQKGSPELALHDAYSKEAGKSGSEFEQGLQQQAAAGGLQNYLLDAMQKDLKELGNDPGKLMGLRTVVSQWKMALGIGSAEDQKLASNSEAATKMSGQLLSAWLKSLSSRPSQMEFVIAADKFIPTGSMTPQGAEKVINAMRATSNRGQHQYETFLKEWKPGKSPDQYPAFTMHWQQKYGPQFPLESTASYPLNNTPASKPSSKFKVLGVEDATAE